MHELWTYRIEVQGPVDERDVNTRSPFRTTVLRVDRSATLLAVDADQSGLIGLLRHLHGRGFVLLSLTRE